jgi:N-acyl-D-amino-acid deacylase
MKLRIVPLAAVFAFVLASCGRGPAEKEASHAPGILIVNASIVDGSGNPPFTGSVRVEGQRIAAVGDVEQQPGDVVVEAGGLALAPGFIDTHSHHDDGLLEQPDALAAVSQGITTIVAGQDGGMNHPLREFFARLEKSPAAVNVASYVGHNTIRALVLGENNHRLATPEEIERMRQLVREGMEAGALGLSTGLEYDPGIFSSHEEVLTLAREAAAHGGRYISHIRSEDRELWKALDEIIEIGRTARIPVQVSHMKLAMIDWWGQADKFIAVMDRARATGVEITGDVYPYEYWQSTLTVMFPERDFSNRKTAEFVLRSIAPPDGLLLSRFSPDPKLVDHTVAEIARMRGTDPATTLMALIAESQVPGAEESVIGTSMHADDVARLIAWPHANICSDGALQDGHPRGAGSFTRVLRVYVRERGTLTLEAAVQKMSAAAAEHVGIADRGRIVPGAYADLLLFDPATVTDNATIKQPRELSTGIRKVWVNGGLVFDDDKATGVHSGQVVRRAGKS